MFFERIINFIGNLGARVLTRYYDFASIVDFQCYYRLDLLAVSFEVKEHMVQELWIAKMQINISKEQKIVAKMMNL